MKILKTAQQTHHVRIGLLLLFSLAIHLVVILQFSQNNPAHPDKLFTEQEGALFSVHLQNINVAAIKSPATVLPEIIKNSTSIKKHSKVQTDKPVTENNLADKNLKETLQPVANSSTNIPDTENVISAINKQLHQYFHYPKLAQKRHWQGKVILKFTISHQGKVENIDVIESSGYDILDQAAVTALNKVSYIAANFNWPRYGMSINLPVIYKLSKG